MTTTRRTRFALVAGVAAIAIATPRAAQAAEAFHAVTSNNTLVSFHSDAPGAIRTATAITGLQAGEQVIGLDVRPQTGQLYALGSTSRLYLVSPISGAATALGVPFSPPLAGSNFGFGFNPAVDRIRIVSDGRQNLRINPDDGAVAAQDPALDYAAGDPGAGANPAVTSAAYTADGKTVYGIDTARDVLVRIDPPNDGKLVSVGALGLDLQEPVSLDIASDGVAYATGRAAGGPVTLFTVDLATGRVTDAAPRPAVSRGYGDVRAIAGTGAVADDDVRPSLLFQIDRHQRRSRLRSRIGTQVACNEACTIVARLVRGRKRLGRGTGELLGAGRTSVRVRMNKRGRRLGKGEGPLRAILRIRVTDAAGNTTSGRRTIRFE